jgi:RNA-binding protein YhbY
MTIESDGLAGAPVWSNSKYSVEDLSSAWKGTPKSLLSIGSVGVKESHVNSLLELLMSFEVVRVKISTDKLDSKAIADEFMKNEIVSSRAELLQCKKREMLLKRLPEAPFQPRKVVREWKPRDPLGEDIAGQVKGIRSSARKNQKST